MRGELENEQNCNILTPPSSSDYSSISFLFSWAAQPGASGPSLCWDMVLIPAPSLQLIWTSCRRGYIIIWHPPTSCERHNSHSIQPFDSQGYPPISSTGCTCYLHRWISYFDSSAGGQYATQPRLGFELGSPCASTIAIRPRATPLNKCTRACVFFLSNLTRRVRCNYWSILKRSKAGLNTEVSFRETRSLTKPEEYSLTSYLLIEWERNRWIDIFLNIEGNANILSQDLNLDRWYHFLRR